MSIDCPCCYQAPKPFAYPKTDWIQAMLESEVVEVLLSTHSNTGYIFRDQVGSCRGGGMLFFADVVERPSEKESFAYTTEFAIVKVFPMEAKDSGGREALNTITAHAFPSPFVVPLFDCVKDESKMYIIEKYIPGGDLFHRLSKSYKEGMSESLAKQWFRDIVDGLLVLKGAKLAHMDISPENILVDEKDNHCMLVDFGLSLILPSTSPCYYKNIPTCGKIGYMCPEIYRHTPVDPFAADIWSLGDPSFRGLERGELDRLMAHYKSMGCKVLEGSAKHLISLMLHPKANMRPTLEEVLKHPWLSNSTCTTSLYSQEKDGAGKLIAKPQRISSLAL